MEQVDIKQTSKRETEVMKSSDGVQDVQEGSRASEGAGVGWTPHLARR